MFRRIFFIFIFFFSCFAFLSAETFRVHRVEVVNISTQEKSQKVRIGYNDALSIRLPENRMFLEGIEMEIKIPQSLLSYKGIIAYALYKNITPEPVLGKIDYTGERVHFDVFPTRLSLILQIPVIKQHGIKVSPYSVLLPYFMSNDDDLIFVRLQPVMKGLPENIEELRFEFDIKPILSNEGLLDLQIAYPPEAVVKTFSLFIDEKPVKFEGESLLLSAGMHHLAIVSEFYKNEVRTFTVEQAGTSLLEIKLKDIVPTLLITAPDNAQVFLDGAEAVAGTTLVIPAGEHTVRFVVGDYEVVKTLNAITGKSYNVSLTIDVQVSETP